MKNVAGYDVARLLVGSKGQLAIITQISFKVLPSAYVGKLNASVKLENKSVLRTAIEQKLKLVFDPKGFFSSDGFYVKILSSGTKLVSILSLMYLQRCL
ncbi:MAG: hypothetical protein H0A76_09450 [Candidatus Thiodubiliella endoseptemdiera]|uniref:Uncharacterized protein n=1 Tax=Candidatus Thiodubiliella endoseptemdiera TaxID=2738886 RepID=A0A853F3H9_9GAMM|nr:hypothetical protein [Candidatus Thiodubiliella endoseptemdiera]